MDSGGVIKASLIASANWMIKNDKKDQAIQLYIHLRLRLLSPFPLGQDHLGLSERHCDHPVRGGEKCCHNWARSAGGQTCRLTWLFV